MSYDVIINHFKEKNYIEGIELAFSSLQEKKIIELFNSHKIPDKNDYKKTILSLALEKKYDTISNILLKKSDEKFQAFFLQQIVSNDIKPYALDKFLKHTQFLNIDAKVLNSCFLIISQIHTEENAILLLKAGANPFLPDKNNYSAFDLAFMHPKHHKTFKAMLSLIHETKEYQHQFLNEFNEFKKGFFKLQEEAKTIKGHILRLKETPISELSPQEEKLLEAEALYQELYLFKQQQEEPSKIKKNIL